MRSFGRGASTEEGGGKGCTSRVSIFDFGCYDKLSGAMEL